MGQTAHSSLSSQPATSQRRALWASRVNRLPQSKLAHPATRKATAWPSGRSPCTERPGGDARMRCALIQDAAANMVFPRFLSPGRSVE